MLTISRSLLVAIFLGIYIVNAVHAQTPTLPAGVTQHASVQGITEYRLPNGLTVLLFPETSKPLLTLNITYRVGSKHENYGETGMAHLLEHLLFKGTPNLSNFAQTMQQRGMQWNGTTYFDRTNYFETFTATPDNLRWALTMEADRMVNSFIAKKDLDSEMTVVRNELERGENNPARILGQRMMSAAFDWHNYGKSTIGAVSDLENVDITRLQAFYKNYYQPDNAVLTLAGRFDPVQTLTWIHETFGKIPKPTRQLQKLYTVEPTQDGERRITVRRSGDAPALSVQYHVPGASHPDGAALALLVNVLATEPSGRIYKALNEPGLAANSYAWLNGLAERGVLIAGAGLEAKHDIARAETALLKALQSIGTVSQEELARAKQEWVADFNQLLKKPESMAVALSESIGQGDWRLLFVQQQLIEKITAKDLERVANTYLKTDNRTVGHFVPTPKPERAPIPAAPDASAVADAAVFAAAQNAGEAFDPSPANLEARTERLKLPNGIELAVLRKQNRGDSVNLRIKLRWSSTAAINASGQARAASWVAAMLQEGSLGLSKQSLGDALNRFDSKINISAGPLGADIAIDSNQTHLAAVLGLLDTVIKKPLFEASALERLRSAQIAKIQAKADRPESLAAEVIAGHNNQSRGLNATDWRFSRTIAQQLSDTKSVAIDDIRNAYLAHWTTRFASIGAIGSLPKNIADLLNQHFGAWSASPQAASQIFERARTPHQAIPALSKSLAVPDKANAVYVAQAAFPLSRNHPDYWLLQIASQVLGADLFNSRIGKRVRVQEGLSYSAYSYMNVDTLDDRAVYIANASFAPQNLLKVQAAMREELAKFVANGISEQELKDAKSSLLQSLEQQRTSDAYLAQHLVYQLETNQNFELHTQHQDRINAASLATVDEAIKKHWANLAMVEVVAGDFDKK